MQTQFKLAVVGLAVLALAACSGNSSSLPGPGQAGQSISHRDASMGTGFVDPTTVHIMRTADSQPLVFNAPQTLRYGGGAVQHKAIIYVVYWGFNVSGSDPSGEQPYLTKFMKGVGGSAWLNTDHQYYETVNSVNKFIRNQAHQLKGTWVDPSSVPSSPTDAQVQAEASSAEAHFGYNKDAAYIVATPHGHNTVGFGTRFCAYHGAALSGGGVISYTNLGYMTDAGSSCGENFVNPGSQGILDGVSIVSGHELAESQTDPHPSNGWYNFQYGEIGDICAWVGLANTTLSTGTFAVQPLWSNSASACVLHSP
jgi:serine protease